MLFFRNKTNINSLIPSDFTDVHSHVLPGIDDGAKTIDDSIEMIKKFQELGINKIITTPHVMGGVWPNSSSVILNKLGVLKTKLKTLGVNDFTLEAAAEYMLDDNFIELLEKKDILTIKENKILIELSYLNSPRNLFDTIFNVQIKGYIPILAHPERYKYYHKDKSKYTDLIRSGALFQLNLLSLTSYYGVGVQRVAFYLLENDMYSFVGTDAHQTKHLENRSILLSKKHMILLEKLMNQNI